MYFISEIEVLVLSFLNRRLISCLIFNKKKRETMPLDLKQQREISRRSADFESASMLSVMPMHFKDLQHLLMTVCLIKLIESKQIKSTIA